MNDTRTEAEKHQAWLRAHYMCVTSGWTHAYGWVFTSPLGTKHDLSAADLNQLSTIVKERLFIVD